MSNSMTPAAETWSRNGMNWRRVSAGTSWLGDDIFVSGGSSVEGPPIAIVAIEHEGEALMLGADQARKLAACIAEAADALDTGRQPGLPSSERAEDL